MIEVINRNDLKSLLVNKGQNEVGNSLMEFSSKIEKIETISDIANLCNLFQNYVVHDKNNVVPKFSRTSEEIFQDKLWSGCSDVATALAPIFRLKGVPTVYLQSAYFGWIEKLNKNDPTAKFIRGHIFLEIYFDNKWMLLDPTNFYLYTNYDYNNLYLPRNYYAFSKSLNGHELGFDSLENNNKLMFKIFTEKNINNFSVPSYEEINLRNLI